MNKKTTFTCLASTDESIGAVTSPFVNCVNVLSNMNLDIQTFKFENKSKSLIGFCIDDGI